jgi:hypothetical protein
MTSPAAFDAFAILGVLQRHEVQFVVIGGIAGDLLGSNILTNDRRLLCARPPEHAATGWCSQRNSRQTT